MSTLFIETLSKGNAILLLFVAIAAPRQTLAHGFALSLVDGKLVAQSENLPVIEYRMFVSTMFDAGPAYASEHGSVEAVGASGLNPSSDTFAMQLEGRLWYSAGGPAMPAADGIALTGSNQYTAEQFKVDGQGVDPDFSGFAISGTDAHEVFNILFGPSILPGAYGYAYRVSGLAGGNPATPYETSDLLVAAFYTPGFSNADAARAIYTAATATPGDFNLDGAVDGADFVIWQTNFPTLAGANWNSGDANFDGAVDGADFVIWQTNFPTVPEGSVAAVPEPGGALLGLAGAALAALLGHFRRRRQPATA